MSKKWELQEKKSMRAAGWKYVSKHRKTVTANKKARATLRKMFKQGRVLPEVKIVSVGKHNSAPHLVFRRWRK